jgi:signal peptidase I
MQDLTVELRKPHIQLAVLLGTLALTLITNSMFGDTRHPLNFVPFLLGISIVFEIVFFVTLEVRDGAQEHGWKHEVMDTLVALVVAVGIWFGASLLLNTGTPLSAVVSCSMLPNLQRGDFVVVQGAPVRAHEISMTAEELDSLTSSRSEITYGEKNASLDGSLFTYCLSDPYGELCSAYRSSPQSVVEKKGAFTYRYERCNLTLTNGTGGSMPCLKSVTFKGEEYLTDFSNDVVVYQPSQGDVYSQIGDIVHRVMFKISVGNETYYLTRGDNNPILDMQVYDYGSGRLNHPIPQKGLRGKVIGRIPLLGYFKLFLSGYFQEDSQCRTQLSFTHDG